MKVKNYYKILNVSKISTESEIKDAYRKLVKFWHPDINKSPNAHERIIEINEAYEILIDEYKRNTYNNIYNIYFENAVSLNTQNFNQQERANKRYAEYINDESTNNEFDILQTWITEARKKASTFIKKADRTIETGFFVVGEIGNFISKIFGIFIIGSIGIGSFGYIVSLIFGNAKLSILGIILSVIGIVFFILYILGSIDEKREKHKNLKK